MTNDPLGSPYNLHGAQPPFIPPTKPQLPWTDKFSAISALAAAAATIITVAKDNPGSFVLLTVGLVAATAFSPVLYLVNRLRHRRHARATARIEAEKLARATIVLNTALKIAHEQLSTRNNSNTIYYATQQLTGYISSSSAFREAQSLREKVLMYCQFTNDLPTVVDTNQARIASHLLNQIVHRFIDDLPGFIEVCEKAADLLEGADSWKRGRTYEQAEILRQRANEFIREYNGLAKQLADPGMRLLNTFDVEKHLRAPVRLPPPKT